MTPTVLVVDFSRTTTTNKYRKGNDLNVRLQRAPTKNYSCAV